MAGEVNDLIRAFKMIANQAVDSKMPMSYTVGRVVSEEYKPLEIKVDEYPDVLKEKDLMLTNAVKDHWQDIEVYWETVDDNDLSEFQANHYANIDTQNANADIHNANSATYNSHTHTGNAGAPTPLQGGSMSDVAKQTKRHTSHLHNIQGRKKIRVYNGLHKGEVVLMVRCPGGQHFIVIDRISNHIVGGEWRTHAGAVLTDQETATFTVSDSDTLQGWQEGVTDESKWKRFSKPPAYSAGGNAPS